MARPTEHRKVEFTDKTDQFFTEGKVYDAYKVGNRWVIEFDDEDDTHGMSDRQLNKWFKRVNKNSLKS